MKFDLNRVELNKLLNHPQGMVGTFIKERGDILVGLAKKQVGVKTGKLRNTIKRGKVLRGPLGPWVRVGSGNRIALIHHQGTRAHIIVPNRKQTLRFAKHGKIVYTKLVHHPGTKPNRYLTDNLDKIL